MEELVVAWFVVMVFLIVGILYIWLTIDEERSQRSSIKSYKSSSDVKTKRYKEFISGKLESHQILMPVEEDKKSKITSFIPFNTICDIEKYKFYIKHEDEIIFSFYEDYYIKLTASKTTGESVIYKDKLKDIRWIRLSENIKRRDHYCCQHCFNIQQLENIFDLYKIVDFEEVATNVISIYNQLTGAEMNFNRVDVLLSDSKNIYIKKFDVWLLSVVEKRASLLEDSYLNDDRISYSVISKTRENKSSDYIYCLKKVSPMRYKGKNQTILFTDRILVEKTTNNLNSNDLFLYHRIDYNHKSFCDFTGRATLYFKEYAITFPLYDLKSVDPLNVHHIRYAQSGNPWDVNESDLITLCQECHMLEHQKM